MQLIFSWAPQLKSFNFHETTQLFMFMTENITTYKSLT